MKNLKKLFLIALAALANIFLRFFTSGSITITNPLTDGFTWIENGRTTIKTGTAIYLYCKNNQFVKKISAVDIFQIKTKNTISDTDIIEDNFTITNKLVLIY
ncbi:MAG: hypothetical protein H7221_06690 [Flavobacterium sp.]|nr:hypothetical protein [Flavobacterium sp.]